MTPTRRTRLNWSRQNARTTSRRRWTGLAASRPHRPPGLDSGRRRACGRPQARAAVGGVTSIRGLHTATRSGPAVVSRTVGAEHRPVCRRDIARRVDGSTGRPWQACFDSAAAATGRARSRRLCRHGRLPLLDARRLGMETYVRPSLFIPRHETLRLGDWDTIHRPGPTQLPASTGWARMSVSVRALSISARRKARSSQFSR